MTQRTYWMLALGIGLVAPPASAQGRFNKIIVRPGQNDVWFNQRTNRPTFKSREQILRERSAIRRRELDERRDRARVANQARNARRLAELVEKDLKRVEMMLNSGYLHLAMRLYESQEEAIIEESIPTDRFADELDSIYMRIDTAVYAECGRCIDLLVHGDTDRGIGRLLRLCEAIENSEVFPVPRSLLDRWRIDSKLGVSVVNSMAATKGLAAIDELIYAIVERDGNYDTAIERCRGLEGVEFVDGRFSRDCEKYDWSFNHVDAIAYDDYPIVHRVVLIERMDSLKYLNLAGIDVDAQAKNGMNALQLAVLQGKSKVLFELIEAGADPLKVAQNDRNAVDFAHDIGRHDLASAIDEANQD